MKPLNLLTAILMVITFSSCSTYQYVFLKSNLNQNEKKEFYYENDSFLINYSFSGKDCPLNIHVYNKLSVPLYVNWRKSAVIIDNKKISLWEDRSSIEGTVDAASIRWNKSESTSSGDFSGSVYRPEPVSFIPPQSYIQNIPLYVHTKSIATLPSDSVSNVKLLTSNGMTRDFKRYNYTSQNTPFNFRCFLSLSTKEDFSTEIYTDNSFWISDIVPSSGSLAVNQSDNYCHQETTEFGTCCAGTALVGLIVVAIIAKDSDDD
jgi:hypothetical protein